MKEHYQTEHIPLALLIKQELIEIEGEEGERGPVKMEF